MPPLSQFAKTLRSKNAGVDLVTFDIVFPTPESYRHVRDSGCLTPQTVAELYHVPESTVVEFVNFDPANAIKFTLKRRTSSGNPGDPDVFGAQQYAPLLDVEVPDTADQ